MTLPNFFLIGAAKSGTSSLYMYLKQHPEIFMSSIKEPHYFSFNIDSKMTQGPGDPIKYAITDFDLYKAQFNEVKEEKAIGEASTSYLYRREAPQRINALLPSVKIIAILRHPADRAFSAYMYLVRDGREIAKDFSEALSLESIRIDDGWDHVWPYTNVGKYYDQLFRYYQLFDREQIQIFLYEDLINDKLALLRKIFGFLEVDQNFIPASLANYNKSGEIKSRTIDQISKWLFSHRNPIRWISRKIFPESWRLNVATWVKIKNLNQRQIPQNIRKELINHFYDNIIQLQDLINRDLSHWLE